MLFVLHRYCIFDTVQLSRFAFGVFESCFSAFRTCYNLLPHQASDLEWVRKYGQDRYSQRESAVQWPRLVLLQPLSLAMLSDRPRPGDGDANVVVDPDEPSRLADVVGAAGEVDSAPPPGSMQPTSSTSTAEQGSWVPPHCHARAAV